MQRISSYSQVLYDKTTNKFFHKLGDKYQRAETIACSPIFTDSDAIFIVNFSKTCSTDLNKTGQLLRLCIVNSLDFYKEKKNIKTKNLNQEKESLSLPNTDSFVNKFIVI